MSEYEHAWSAEDETVGAQQLNKNMRFGNDNIFCSTLHEQCTCTSSKIDIAPTSIITVSGSEINPAEAQKWLEHACLQTILRFGNWDIAYIYTYMWTTLPGLLLSVPYSVSEEIHIYIHADHRKYISLSTCRFVNSCLLSLTSHHIKRQHSKN
jgi:hypothetical protein